MPDDIPSTLEFQKKSTDNFTKLASFFKYHYLKALQLKLPTAEPLMNESKSILSNH